MTELPALLRTAFETGDLGALAGAYAPGATLELSVPGERSSLAGGEAIAERLGRMFDRPSELVEWRPQESEHGVALWFEAFMGEGRALRQRHYLHVRDGLVERHWIYSAPPRSTAPAVESNDSGRRAVERVGPVAHQEVLASTGWSGARLERAQLVDGRSVVAKHLDPQSDWLGRASGDRGREALLVRDLLERLPAAVDNAVLEAVELEDGWWLVMRDVSADLLDDPSRPITRAEHRRVMAAMNSMWDEFWNEDVPHVMSVENRLRLVSPELAEVERDASDLLPKQLESAWQAFAEVVDPDVGETVVELAQRPAPLAERLDARGSTLIHGDLRDEQMGFAGDGIVLIDWGLATQGHPVVELAWYMCHCCWRIEASHDEVVEDFRRARGDADDPDALALGLLSGLVQYGWILGLAARIHTDPSERAWARSELDWWVPRAREALELL